MSDALTARQTQILKFLVDEYIETAVPVGSENLEKKYSLGVSPATVRNEMVALTNTGYLRQPHASAGRVPTPKAMKFYVNQLMEEKQMTVAEEVKAKEEVWDARKDLSELLEEATHVLAERTRNLAIAALDDGKVWHSGYANVFSNPEFTDLEVCTNLFTFLEEARRVHQLFFEIMGNQTPVEVLFGEEIGWPELTPLGVAATRFRAQGKDGALGVIGPVRLSYPTVIPMLRYFKKMIQDIAK